MSKLLFCNSRIAVVSSELIYYPNPTWSSICLNCGTVLSAHISSRGPCPNEKEIEEESYRIYEVTPEFIEHAFFEFYRGIICL